MPPDVLLPVQVPLDNPQIWHDFADELHDVSCETIWRFLAVAYAVASVVTFFMASPLFGFFWLGMCIFSLIGSEVMHQSQVGETAMQQLHNRVRVLSLEQVALRADIDRLKRRMFNLEMQIGLVIPLNDGSSRAILQIPNDVLSLLQR